VSFAGPADLDVLRVARGLNGMLGPEVSVARVRRGPAGFDARHSATARRYRYRLHTAVAPDPFTARFVWHRPGSLRVGRMRAAARELTGEHDFASFCRPPQPPGASTVRHLRRLTVAADGENLSVVAEANGFLHQMVRSLVGTLVAVGEGRMEPAEMAAVLRVGDRSAAGPVAPPHGLALEHVTYGRGPTRNAGRPSPRA
jgi:tRNA pseudouridine38-40 synthase